MSDPAAAARAEGAPTLPELRATLEASLQAYPALRQGLAAALAQVKRATGEEPVPRRRDRRRADGLR